MILVVDLTRGFGDDGQRLSGRCHEGFNPSMWFGVLGSLEVRDSEGLPLRVAGPVRRVLLAALLCRQPHSVPPDVLIDDAWGPLPPRSAAKTLQSHIVRLRDDLGRGAGSVIVTDGTGYRIVLPPAGLDAVRFERALAEGVDAEREGRSRRAIALLDDALSCWRDEAYLDFGEAPFAITERMRLAELRALALETRTDAALRLGESATLVSELEARVTREPYRERSWEQLITALYRAGRQAGALATYRTAHQRLAGDLGVDPGPSLRALEQQILRQDPSMLADTPIRPSSIAVAGARGVCPYRGLEGYGTHDAAVFVGRERLSAQLVGRLAEAGVVVVTGTSGSGKSSLVRAGLVPSLRAGALPGSAGWRIRVATPADGSADDPDLDLLVLDQAEELFTLIETADRDRFVAALESFVNLRGGRLVLVLRGDFYARLAELPWLAEYAQRSPLLVGPMRESELARVVTEPARRAGIEVDPTVVDAVLEDAAEQPQPLPLISLALVRTWEHRVGTSMTLESYESGHGVAGAIEATAEATYQAMAAELRIESRRLLVRLATREGATWARRPLPRPPSPTTTFLAALDALAIGRLITVTPNRIELSHDALLEHWPRLREWLDVRLTAVELLEHLAAASAAWSAAGRPATDLYRGARLHAALDWLHGHPQDVAGDDEAFLQASAVAAEAELHDARARAAIERKGRRHLRRVVAALAVVVVAAVAGALVAVNERSAANRSAADARQAALSADARRLAALSLSAPDIATSALLATAGYRLNDSADTRGALLSTLIRNQSALFHIVMPRRIIRMVASVDGSRLYAQDNNRTVHVIDPARRAIVNSYPSRSLTLLAVPRGGSDLLVAGYASAEDPNGGGRVSVLSAIDGSTRHILTLDAMDGPDVPSLAPGGRWLTTVRAADSSGQRPSRTLVVYDAAQWTRAPRTMELPAPIINIAAGLSVAAAETADGTIYLLDLSSLAVLAHVHRTDLPTMTSAASGSPFTIAPDGRHVAYLLSPMDKEPRLLATNHLNGTARPLPTPQLPTNTLRFSPDGTQLAAGAADGSVNVYRTSDGGSIATLAGHSGSVLAVAWGSHNALYTAGLDSQVVSWDVGQLPRLLHASGPSIETADHAERFGDQVVGEWPVQGNFPESTERLFDLDLRNGSERSWAAGLSDDDYINQNVATPDGALALVSIQRYRNHVSSNRFELWDERRGILLNTITPPTTADESLPLSAAISPDGRSAVAVLRRGQLGVLALPSGRLERTVSVSFTGRGAERILLDAWQYDPNGKVLVSGADQGPPDPAPPGQPDPGGDSSTPNQRLGLLDPATGRLIAQVAMGNVDLPTAVAWSHDRRLLAVGTSAGTLTSYDARSLRPQHSAGSANAGYVLSASFAADDRTLVTAGTDASMTFWDAATMSRVGSRVSTPSAAASWWYAWYTPDGMVSGLAPDAGRPDQDQQRWFTFPAAAANWAQLACSLAATDITPAQWSQYVGDRPYRHVC